MIEPEPNPPPSEPESPPAPDFPLPWALGWSVLCLGAFFVVGGTAQFLHLAWGLWFSEVVLFAGLTVVGFQLIRLRPLRAMGLDRFDGGSLALGFAFGLINYFAWAVPSMALAQAVFPKSMVELFDSAQIFERNSAAELAIVLVGVVIAAPFGEELFFRGFMQRGLEASRGAPRAIVVSAFVFSAFHLDPVGLLARFELGVLFGLLAWRSGSLWAALGAHAANNAISSVLFFLSGKESAEAELTWWVPVSMFVVGNLLLVGLVRASWGRLSVARPGSLEPELQAGAVGRFAPWVAVVGLASLALVLAVDFRGVRLNVVDGLVQVPRAVRKRDDVKELRARARRGEVPIDDYEALIRTLK